MLEKIKQALELATGLKVKPLATKEVEECIVYSLSPISDDGAVAQHRLELRLITKTYANAVKHKKQIIETLVNTGDNRKIEGIYNCNLNGGGQMKEFDTDTIHTLLYFDLITRSLN